MKLPWLAVIAFLATHAVAEAQTHVFAIGAAQLQLPLPEGYCIPKGKDLAQSQRNAALDTANQTVGQFFACGLNFGADYILLKTPNGMTDQNFDKADMVEGLATYFKESEGDTSEIAMIAQIEQQLGKRFGAEGDTKLTEVYAGRDEDCAYLAGTLKMTVASGQAKSGLFVTCGTVVEGKILSINSYRLVEGATVAELKAQTRAIARSVAKAS